MSHSAALETTLTAANLGPRYAALIALCRLTAKQMDAAGDSPSNRLSAVYLSTLKDLSRAQDTGKTTASTKPAPSHLGSLRSNAAGLTVV